ncbi:MAG: DNA adenine methylase [Pirellulaceae bacterium]|nr:DNA adenine methylase [Pirellulaceae bacterium]
MRTAGNIPHPIPYQGSKRWLAPTIFGCIPAGVRTFYEPFAGSAAASLYVASGLPNLQLVLGDLHPPVAALWRTILESPHVLADEYERLWTEQQSVGREHFNQVRAAFNADPRPEFFLYLLARCVKAAIRYNRNGEFNNTADHRRLGAHPATMRDQIVRAAKILAGRTRVLNAHYLDTLHDADPRDVIYLDPPYQGTSGDRDNRYVKGMSFAEFCEGLEQLARRDLSLIVSYDGRIGDKVYGQRLPPTLDLKLFEVRAGRSTQETLLGRDGVTYESLYVSESLLGRIPRLPRLLQTPEDSPAQNLLF